MRFSELLTYKAQAEHGEDLGRVQNLIVAKAAKSVYAGTLTITGLVLGKRGFLERLGFKHTHALEVPISAIFKVERKMIIVQAARIKHLG